MDETVQQREREVRRQLKAVGLLLRKRRGRNPDYKAPEGSVFALHPEYARSDPAYGRYAIADPALTVRVVDYPLTLDQAEAIAMAKPLEVAAHHEAGHAVAAWKEGLAIHRVSIVPSENAGGFVHAAGSVESLIRMHLAGPIAQKKFNPKSWRLYQCASDYRKASDLVLTLVPSEQWADRFMSVSNNEAQAIVDEHWELIRAFAAELMARREMTGAEATAVIQAWHDSDFKCRQAGEAVARSR